MGAASGKVVCVAGLKLPVTGVAISVSVLIHGVLFGALGIISFTPPVQTKPRIQLARGNSAIQVIFLSTPWPEPEEEIEEQPPVDEDAQDRQESLDTIADETVEPEPPRTAEANPLPSLNDDEILAPHPAVRPTSPPPGHEQLLRSPSDSQHSTEVGDEGDGETSVADAESNDANSPGKQDLIQVDIVDRRETRRSYAPAMPKTDKAPRHVDNAQPSVGDSGVESGVEVLDLPRPEYPLISRRRGEEGVVLLRVEVLASGRSGRITVLSGPGHPRLTKSAIKAARKARFQPAMQNGKPIKTVVRIPFRFVLH